jgi:hypothetical protein
MLLGLKDEVFEVGSIDQGQFFCRGDNYLGRPWAEQPAGWRPRDRHDTRPMRPASTKELAALATGQDLLH